MRALTAVSIIGLLTTAGSLAIINAKNVEERALRATIGDYEACASAVTNADLVASAARCSTAVAAVHSRAVRAQRCDAGLAAGDRFAIDAACSTPVKTLDAERTAATAERDNLTSLLARVRSDQAAAIARAEIRGRTQAQRTQSVQTRLDSAPRTDAGLGRCDADCLRDLGPD